MPGNLMLEARSLLDRWTPRSGLSGSQSLHIRCPPFADSRICYCIQKLSEISGVKLSRLGASCDPTGDSPAGLAAAGPWRLDILLAPTSDLGMPCRPLRPPGIFHLCIESCGVRGAS